MEGENIRTYGITSIWKKKDGKACDEGINSFKGMTEGHKERRCGKVTWRKGNAYTRQERIGTKMT